MNGIRTPQWPKRLPPLTAEQQRISDDFMKLWHEVLPSRFGIVDRFNHRYPVRHAPPAFISTLEIGAGLGEHLQYEQLTPDQEAAYCAVDIRQNMMDELHRRFPRVLASVGDCQQRMAFPDGHFDRILAIHVLEHLPDFPLAVREMHRLCRKDSGVFSVVIPCEGGFAYGLARRISAQRVFEKRYRQPYGWFISREHINRPHEILAELDPYFEIAHRQFFPLGVPLADFNLCIGLTCRPRPRVRVPTAGPGGASA